MILILTPGNDPMEQIKKFADETKPAPRLESVSLGKGQGDKAKQIINDLKSQNYWIIL